MDATREKLLDAAGAIFAEKGYEAATVRDICSKAGTNVAAINYHFGDKEKLYIAAVQYAHCHKGHAPRSEWPAGTRAETKLHDYIRDMLEAMMDTARPTWETELIMKEMARPTAACVELVKSFIGPRFVVLHSILDELLPKSVNAKTRHLLGFSVVSQCLVYRFHRPVGELLVGTEEFSTYDVDLLSDHITRFCLQGFAAFAAPPARKRAGVASGRSS